MKKTLALLTALLLAGCSASGGTSSSDFKSEGAYNNSYSTEYYAADEEAAEMAYAPAAAMDADSGGIAGGVNMPAVQQSDEKIVYTGSLSIETKNYEQTLQTLNDTVQGFGGIVSHSDESAYRSGMRNLYITVRIPSDKFNDFMSGASVLGNIRSKSTGRSDITKQYNDRSIEMQALETQLAKLQEMLEQAQTIEEMLMIEDRLVDVETRLNQIRSVISNMDMDVAYSTVDLSISEVVQYSSDVAERKDETFADRLRNAFQDSAEITADVLETVFFTLIRFAPLLMIAGALAFLWRKYREKHPRRWSFRRKKDQPKE